MVLELFSVKENSFGPPFRVLSQFWNVVVQLNENVAKKEAKHRLLVLSSFFPVFEEDENMVSVVVHLPLPVGTK